MSQEILNIKCVYSMATRIIQSFPIVISMELWLATVLSISSLASDGYSQMTWTPIFVGGANQVDFWTSSETGCTCSFNSSRQDCACCVLSGGCSCGIVSPRRCAQCGLEQHCTNMCNITIDSKDLLTKSNQGFGQIKSPSVVGPSVCSYIFIPDTGQRLELQIYRLISIGRYDGKTCTGGWLQLEGGARICGSNTRFDRPVVLFSDKSRVTLYMQIDEVTSRSQFLAYFSFASKSSASVGWPMRGGVAINNTECDWIYEDCMNSECILASPAYPGLYPPNVRCHYLINLKMNASITIVFDSVLLPFDRCSDDYIAVYADTNRSGPLLGKLCNNEKITVVHFGSSLLVEFKSGSELAPFSWNGFHAQVSITNTATTQSTITTIKDDDTTENSGKLGNNMKNSVKSSNVKNHRNHKNLSRNECDVQVNGDQYRSGHYDTRTQVKSSSSCHIFLRGRIYDTVHLFLTSYNLSRPECKSIIEIWDGVPVEDPDNTSLKFLKKICSPDQKHEQKNHHSARYTSSGYYSSTGREMTAVLRRDAANYTQDETEFMNIFYYFHDEREGGTLRPTSACDVEYYGLTSPKQGELVNPITNLIQNENYIKCKQHFIPAANQSIMLTVAAHVNQFEEKLCSTLCGDSGCRCVSQIPLDNINHIELVSEISHIIICLCGNFQSWLPLTLRSWSPLYVEWLSGSSMTWNMSIQVAYEFVEDSYCGDRSTMSLEGTMSAGDLSDNAVSNEYYYQKCSLILDSTIDRQLNFAIESSQNRPCTAWNLTIHEYKKSGNPIGQRFYTFCSRDRRKNFTLPWKINAAIVRLQALGRTAPQYIMKWNSITVAANIRRSGPSPAPNYVSKSSITILLSQHQRITLSLIQSIIHFTFSIFTSALYKSS